MPLLSALHGQISNLNRQFLFRQLGAELECQLSDLSDVGSSKSHSAARAAKAMNKDLKVSAMEVRVGPDTEDTFDDAFWEGLDCVVNALDNIQARLYVDSRCVWFSKPLLESGTLGTKANVQVVLPKLTQSYGDSQDPPEESIPLCTVKDTTGEGCMDDDEAARRLMAEMAEKGKAAKSKADLQPAEFEKDDDSNFHIQFIAAAANLRARNYKIPEADFHKVKMTAGKIIPAIATTTAMATGLVSAELLKIANLQARKLEDFKNAFVTLALPLWVLSEPLPPVKTVSKDHDPIIMGPVKAKPEGFTTWDKVECRLGDATLQAFLDFLTDEVGVEVMIMSSGNACLYNAYVPAHKKRLKEKITDLWETITKQKLSAKRTYLTLEVLNDQRFASMCFC
ncbi:unnamed protein product [Effrenium voratum]|nr:unnamed protein product [Effrenium voratum]